MSTKAALRAVTSMDAALEADGEKLRQLTGEDHGPFQTVAQAIGETDPFDDFASGSEFAAGDAAADAFADAVTGALASSLDAEGPIKPARDWAEEQLSLAVKEEEELQREIAAAGAACNNIVHEAVKTRDAIVEKANLKLRRATGFRAALAIFKGELVKAEL